MKVYSDTDDVRPVLGRLDGLDLFDITFNQGKYVIMNNDIIPE